MDLDLSSQSAESRSELVSSQSEDDNFSKFSGSDHSCQPSFLFANTMYVLMPKNIPMSRASRLQWFLDKINTIVKVASNVNLGSSSTELEILSVLATENNQGKVNGYFVTSNTKVYFLAHMYRFVYCIDMSPSQSTVDIEKGEVLFDEILYCFKNSLEGICRQFTIPCNSFVFQPCIYLTVIVNTPFFISPAQQVLVKGVKVSLDNINEIIKLVQAQFYFLEGRIAQASAMAHDELEVCKIENGFPSSYKYSDNNELLTNIPMVSPDANFVNMLRYSMLAISLLPEISLSHILVITDGVVAMPDGNIMESLLLQLHYESISLSFMKVGSSFNPHSSAGYVSYTDLLHFMSNTTMGTCIDNFLPIESNPSNGMNMYQELYLLWSFHSTINQHPLLTIQNESFHNCNKPVLLSKKQSEEKINSSILLLLFRRMREGYTVDKINYANGYIEIKLSLQWKKFIYIQYILKSQWPMSKNYVQFEVHISAPYEFLHDITCPIKKEVKSSYRQAVIDRFWLRLTQLSTGDTSLAQQLSSFQNSSIWYSLPESVRSGISVFILNGIDTTKLVLLPSDVSCPKFVSTWQSICQIESNNWRKWFHTYKISLILKHDHPLPRHLHLSNSSGRFQVVQCRQAATTLYNLLSEWASFVLIDTHTYLKLLYREHDKPPVWFCIVRVMSKLPCIVLSVGFTTGTPGYIRNKMCEDLKLELSALCYLSSPIKSTENICCILLHKPLEKILIRYERMPNDFTTVIFPDGTQPPQSAHWFTPSPLTGTLFTTLSRYLFHKRCIWGASNTLHPKLGVNAISRILSTLTRMRLKEGFCFVHSSSGITTMALELPMKPNSTCIVQYVLFPPYSTWKNEKEFTSGSEEDLEHETDSESELQMVTEVWIEPQYGTVQPTCQRISYLDNKHYYEIADVIREADSQCINSLLTLEHLSLMSQERSRLANLETLSTKRCYNCVSKFRKASSVRNVTPNSFISDIDAHINPSIAERILHIPFKFDAISILPICQQTELLFSMFLESNEKLFTSFRDIEKSNKLLLENIQDYLQCLHDHELEITLEESLRFSRHVIDRHKFKDSCPIQLNTKEEDFSNVKYSQWRCFIKGISVTHIIITFIPATLHDLKCLVSVKESSASNENHESHDRTSSRGSNFSDVPINVTNAFPLPLYIYDCPLASLVDYYVNNYDETSLNSKDVYEDHRFKSGPILQEDLVKLKLEVSNESPEPKSEDSEMNEPKTSIKQHCKALVLAYTKCFVMSLFSALQCGAFVHSLDVQSAMDQCEETVYDIDITYYLQTVCAHLKQTVGDKVTLQDLNNPTPCLELAQLHRLIKEKFFEIINVAFSPIPTNKDFYFCQNLPTSNSRMKDDSDDENTLSPTELVIFRSESIATTKDVLENGSRGYSYPYISPLFLHLICTIRYNNNMANTSVKVLPTCLGELIENVDLDQLFIEKSKLQITLDILCLTLPVDVQNVINDYSSKGLRHTSFCSDGFQSSVDSTVSENSYTSEFPDPLIHLPEIQRRAVATLRDEVKWLLKDEIATALLDVELVTTTTLNFVISHVNDSVQRPSCLLDIIDLNFVYGSNQSHNRFIQEFSEIEIPSYRICKKDDLYYLIKQKDVKAHEIDHVLFSSPLLDISSYAYLSSLPLDEQFELTAGEVVTSENLQDLDDAVFKNDDSSSQQSDISSVHDSQVGTDGYDEDISEDEEDYSWLNHLDGKRKRLPNFWLIMKVDQDAVTLYFHCRFMELPTTLVGTYMQIQRDVREAIRDLCKRVNQTLLLQSLNGTRTCDILLEPDDDFNDWHSNTNTPTVTRNTSFVRLKSMDEGSDESEPYPTALIEASLKFKAGYFSCPVVWRTHFVLHPRLKTGPGKTGLSRGVLALKTVLDKFSVSNRNNMFVYQDVNSNVFYLRLYENVQGSNYGKSSSSKMLEFDHSLVSRSPSIASLPLGQQSNLAQSDHSIGSTISSDIRPRVRSFGEKETKETPNEDVIILNVHGITEAGEDVRLDLVQVLQNRLDDAVLEFLSVMLARNVMCPLTPEDVHFLQKPFRLPEVTIKLSLQTFTYQYLQSFIHYLRQNLLQFLNIPKYTDSRSHCHFKDYSENEHSFNKVVDNNIFIYNQSQNPSCGSKGIACIALAVISHSEVEICKENLLKNIFREKHFEDIVATDKIRDTASLPGTYVEFRVWKQGRVNTENLFQKLQAAVSQAMWDIIMEYYILKVPLCDKDDTKESSDATDGRQRPEFSRKEVECDILLFGSVKNNISKSVMQRQHFHEKLTDVSKLITPTKKHKRVIPLNSTARRSITFDDNKSPTSISGKMHLLKCDPYELGDMGTMTRVTAVGLPNWLDFAYKLSVPTVKKYTISLNTRHLLYITIRELQTLITQLSTDTTKAFISIPTENKAENSEEIFIPYNTSQSPHKCILIARNFDQWKAYSIINDLTEFPDFVNPKYLKHIQKFSPTFTPNNIFIPRQKILWAVIESNSIVVYTYNWSKENVEKLIENGKNLGLWLNARGSTLNSIISQKLGLFFNQPLARKALLSSNNPYLNHIGEIEYMIKCPRDRLRRSANVEFTNTHIYLEAFRDCTKPMKLQHNDPVIVYIAEMLQIRRIDKKFKDELKKLHSMWQSRTSTCNVVQIQILKQHSRIIHYCHTPLLFMSRWRLQSAATRDHSLSPPVITKMTNTFSGFQRRVDCSEDRNWHSNLCYGFISEYREYLQTLGFMPLQIDDGQQKKIEGPKKDNEQIVAGTFYVQKAMLGGILIFSINLNEPFFITKVYAVECNRLQPNNSKTFINQFTLSFLDECDRIKILMHLHSFTYDFHLRCIYNYISNSSETRVCQGYHLTKFLDDFMKYYNKAPNFARNLVHEDTIVMPELVTEGKQLYDYLLSNGDQYNMDVFTMRKDENEDTEYVLVQLTSTPQFSYKDSQDCQHTDDFDVTLIISHIPSQNMWECQLHLKYYLILTSRKEIYPKLEVDRKLGKFRTVSSTFRSISNSDKNKTETKSDENPDPCDSENESCKLNDDSLDRYDEDNDNYKSQNVPRANVEIKQESVNYLGYYSSHEQLMQQLIFDCAKVAQKQIQQMVTQGVLDCRTHLLWNKLVSHQESNNLTYVEFMELKSLAKMENLCDFHPNLRTLLNQPLVWYQGLAKLLLSKYSDHHRCLISTDGNVQHYIILHPRYNGAFMLLSMDLHTSRGDLYAVYRASHKFDASDVFISDRKTLLDGFINCICFYIWTGMI